MKKLIIMLLVLIATSSYATDNRCTTTTIQECPTCEVCQDCDDCIECPTPPSCPQCPSVKCPNVVCPEIPACNCPEVPACPQAPDCICPDQCPSPCDNVDADISGTYALIGLANGNGWELPEVVLGTITITPKGEYGFATQCITNPDGKRIGCATYLLRKK